jgi:class 3 adenylate cyclase
LTLHVRVDRPRCIGAGNCVAVAPTVFDWLHGDLLKAMVLDDDSVDEEMLRAATMACPTQAIELEEVGDLLPWALRSQVATTRRVEKTFMFRDIVGSTGLAAALGDEAWQTLLAWHDETLRAQFAANSGEEVVTTGDGFFVGFDAPDDAINCAMAIQRMLSDHRRTSGFAPQVRIGIHLANAQQVGRNYHGLGVHEAARIAAAAEGGEIIASRETVEGTRFASLPARPVELKGLAEPLAVVSIDWK